VPRCRSRNSLKGRAAQRNNQNSRPNPAARNYRVLQHILVESRRDLLSLSSSVVTRSGPSLMRGFFLTDEIFGRRCGIKAKRHRHKGAAFGHFSSTPPNGTAASNQIGRFIFTPGAGPDSGASHRGPAPTPYASGRKFPKTFLWGGSAANARLGLRGTILRAALQLIQKMSRNSGWGGGVTRMPEASQERPA
jgi:hypothetical protein